MVRDGSDHSAGKKQTAEELVSVQKAIAYDTGFTVPPGTYKLEVSEQRKTKRERWGRMRRILLCPTLLPISPRKLKLVRLILGEKVSCSP